MKKSTAYLYLLIIFIITLPICFITLIVFVVINNGLVKKRNQVDYSFSSIDVMLKKRGDLIPNLVESVKKYMAHEQDTFEKIISLRNQIKNVASNSEERFSMENEMSGLLKNLTVTVENYPELKSSENMLQLQRSLTETEEQISAARRAYNASVNQLNNAVQTFPSNLIAAVNNFSVKPYFEADETAKANPNLGKLFNS
ncbi:LemA family protein [Flavobacterium pedocola]